MADSEGGGFDDVTDLVKSYASQELVDPLKALGRFLGFGVAGAVLLGLGIMLLAVGLLRLLQVELADTFDGNWSFVPYAIVVVVGAIVIGLFASRIGKGLDGD